MAFRSYIALQYVVGENVAIEFKVSEEGQCAPLYDYTLEATLQTKCGGSFDFTFRDDANYYPIDWTKVMVHAEMG